MKMNREEEARAVLSALEGLPEDDPQIQSELDEMRTSLHIAGQSRFRDLFTNGELRLLNRTCLACGGQMFQQMVSTLSLVQIAALLTTEVVWN